MARPYLEPAIEEMKTYMIVSVYPLLNDGDIVSRIQMRELMARIGLPAIYRGLDKYARSVVLYEALDQLGWQKFSRSYRHTVKAWIKPEVIRNV